MFQLILSLSILTIWLAYVVQREGWIAALGWFTVFCFMFLIGFALGERRHRKDKSNGSGS